MLRSTGSRARQHSLAHRTQALGLGMTSRQIQARLDRGWLVPVHRRVYGVAGGPSSPEQALLAAYPSLRAEDLNAWAYARSHSAEIETQICGNEAA